MEELAETLGLKIMDHPFVQWIRKFKLKKKKKKRKNEIGEYTYLLNVFGIKNHFQNTGASSTPPFKGFLLGSTPGNLKIQ